MAGIDDAFNVAETGASAIPGVGTAISAGLGIGQGVFNLIKSNREQKKAQGLRPPLEDPEMRMHLGYLERKRRAIETGTAYGRQTAEIGSQLANTQEGIVEASGGNAGAAIAGLTRAQRGAGEAYGNLVEKGAPLIASYEGNISNVLKDISQRRADLQLNAFKTAEADSAILNKSGEEAVMGGIARILPMAFPKRTPIAPPTNNVQFNPAVTANAPYRSVGMNATPYAEQSDIQPMGEMDMSDPNSILSRRRNIPYYNPLQLPQ
jgi:hypothetical protein